MPTVEKKDTPAGDDARAKHAKVPKLEGTAKTFVERLLRFFVAAAIGLAPLLGRAKIPGFSALLSMIPSQLHGTLIPLGALVMGVAVVTTDFWAGDKPLRRNAARTTFVRLLVAAAVCVIGMLYVQTRAVARVSIEGGGAFASYVVGFSPRQLQGPICPTHCNGLSPSQCIKDHLRLDSDIIATCFGSEAVATAEMLYGLLYLATLGVIAAMVSVGMLAARQRKLQAQ